MRGYGFSCAAIFVSSLTANAEAQDLATNMCRAYEPVVLHALDLRQAGVPVAAAERMARSAADTDQNLYSFVLNSIDLAYARPGDVQDALSSGRWLSVCASAVRGY
jgi:hypothetical protein